MQLKRVSDYMIILFLTSAGDRLGCGESQKMTCASRVLYMGLLLLYYIVSVWIKVGFILQIILLFFVIKSVMYLFILVLLKHV